MEQIRKMFVQNGLSYVYEDLCREKMGERWGRPFSFPKET